MLFNTAKVNTRNEGFVRRQPWFERTRLFADGLLQMARSLWTNEHEFKYSIKADSSHNITRVVRWRFVFSDDPPNETYE